MNEVRPIRWRDGALELPERWETVVVTPGHDPWGTWVAALTPISPLLGRAEPHELAAALATFADERALGVLLVVDQLEELATLSEGESRKKAVALLEELALRPRPGVRVLVAGRRDLLDPLIALSTGFGTALARGALFVGPIDDGAWGDIVDEALGAYGVRFDSPATRAELLEQLRGKGSAMPLAQFALTELWSRRDRTTKTLSRAALADMGGVDGALRRHADKTADALVAGGHEAALRSILLALSTAKGTRAIRPVGELERAGGGAATRDLVGKLVEARLIVEEPEGFTLAHEALLTQWPRLAAWLADAAIDRRVAEDLEQAVAAWRRDPADLWKSARLAVGEQVVARELVPLPEGAREFVAASRAAERRGRVVAGVFVGVAFAAVVGIAAFFASERSKAEGLRAQAEQQRSMAASEREQATAAAAAAEQKRAQAEKESEAARAASQKAEESQKKAEAAQAKLTEELKKVDSMEKLLALKAQIQGGVAKPAPGPKRSDIETDPF